jgi:DNA-binding CsgD family transcriptional regulator
MPTQPNSLASIYSLLQAQSVRHCVALFREVLATYNIDTFATGEVDVENRARAVFHVIEWPEDWHRYYFESDLIDRDPVVQALQHHKGAFTWEELRQSRAMAKLGTQALAKAADAGWVDGLVVPIRRTSQRFAIISLVARHALINAEQKQVLVPHSVCFHSRVLELFQFSDFPVPPAGLAAREVECIALAAQGLTDEKIARALSIGATSAHEYLNRARDKLQAKNRTELVALAVALGIVRS